LLSEVLSILDACIYWTANMSVHQTDFPLRSKPAGDFCGRHTENTWWLKKCRLL